MRLRFYCRESQSDKSYAWRFQKTPVVSLRLEKCSCIVYAVVIVWEQK